MKEPVRVKYEYIARDEKGEVTVQVQVDEEIEFPDSPPVPFHAFYSLAYHRHWEEKRALKKRIEELEQDLVLAIEF